MLHYHLALLPPHLQPRPGGVFTVMVLVLTNVTLVAVFPAKVTVTGALKFVPLIVTKVPPAVGPEGSDIPVMLGGAAYV